MTQSHSPHLETYIPLEFEDIKKGNRIEFNQKYDSLYVEYKRLTEEVLNRLDTEKQGEFCKAHKEFEHLLYNFNYTYEYAGLNITAWFSSEFRNKLGTYDRFECGFNRRFTVELLARSLNAMKEPTDENLKQIERLTHLLPDGASNKFLASLIAVSIAFFILTAVFFAVHALLPFFVFPLLGFILSLLLVCNYPQQTEEKDKMTISNFHSFFKVDALTQENTVNGSLTTENLNGNNSH